MNSCSRATTLDPRSFLDFFQHLLRLQIAVDVDRALFARARAQRALCHPGLEAGLMRLVVGRAVMLVFAIKDVPARGEHQQVSQAGECKAFFVNEMVDPFYLEDIEIRIQPVIGVGRTEGLDKALFFILADTFLGEVNLT